MHIEKSWSKYDSIFILTLQHSEFKCMGCGQTDALNPTQLFINFVDLYKVTDSPQLQFSNL